MSYLFDDHDLNEIWDRQDALRRGPLLDQYGNPLPIVVPQRERRTDWSLFFFGIFCLIVATGLVILAYGT